MVKLENLKHKDMSKILVFCFLIYYLKDLFFRYIITPGHFSRIQHNFFLHVIFFTSKPNPQYFKTFLKEWECNDRLLDLTRVLIIEVIFNVVRFYIILERFLFACLFIWMIYMFHSKFFWKKILWPHRIWCKFLYNIFTELLWYPSPLCCWVIH